MEGVGKAARQALRLQVDSGKLRTQVASRINTSISFLARTPCSKSIHLATRVQFLIVEPKSHSVLYEHSASLGYRDQDLSDFFIGRAYRQRPDHSAVMDRPRVVPVGSPRRGFVATVVPYVIHQVLCEIISPLRYSSV